MSTRYTLENPALFDFIDNHGRPCRGADQEWYRDEWQRRAGCGPTTAATCLSYLAQKNHALRPLAPSGGRNAADFVAYMEDVWQQVTPTNKGLHSLELYWGGALEFARLRGCTLAYDELAIPGKLACERPTLAACVAFLKTAITADRPVAFLNYSNGELTNLDSWHWVPLVQLTVNSEQFTVDGAVECVILDEGLEKTIDFGLWYQSSLRGGGLVALKPNA